jgi:signal transduction histidine kinase
MHLAEFITSEMESILVEWEAFARSQVVATAMTDLQLRDHAKQILQAVALDLATAQSGEAQREKSLGRAPEVPGAPDTAAETHAVLRARSGFDINQLASEYRALRASVLRLWAARCPLGDASIDDVIRFNEAIDQALAESLQFYSAEVEQSRNLLLGMLGHDMRTPLQTILLTAQYLRTLDAGDGVSTASARLINSGGRIRALLDDLVDFNRTRLGLGIGIQQEPVDLEHAFGHEVDSLRAAHPNRHIEIAFDGDASGHWDARRLQQVLANLVENAFKYGATDKPVRVAVAGDGESVTFEVRNHGAALSPDHLQLMFDPLQRGAAEAADDTSSLGLGLYIAREIARAHGGEIGVTSEGGETVFSVSLPRGPAPAA